MTGAPETTLEISGEGRSWTVALKPYAVCTVGRVEGNTLVLDGELVSRHHAVLQPSYSGQFMLADLGSRNSTMVNGVRVNAPVALFDGDHIRIGEYTLTFRRAGQGGAQVQEPNNVTKLHMSPSWTSVMVVDIRDSTTLWNVPGSASEVMVAFNNEVGSLMMQERASALKYTGDGFMAFWVHDDLDTLELPRIMARGLVGVAEIASRLRKRFDLSAPVRIGASVDVGLALLGNVGSQAASDHTIIGDLVNRAFRLEAATRNLGCDLVVSEEAYQDWLLVFRDLDFPELSLDLKGFAQRVGARAGSFARLRALL
jgi:adenylate cyclase